MSTIPVDIDVDQVYLLRCILSAPGNELSKILNDGRSYQGKTTTCKANKDIFKFGKSVNVYNNKCKGSMVCVNDNCEFKKRFHVIHQISMSENVITDGLCTACGANLTNLPCDAVKRVSFQNLDGQDLKQENHILVEYKKASHTCLPRHKIQETCILEIQEYFAKHPGVKPSVAWFNVLSSKILKESPSNEIHELISLQLTPWILGNLKADAKKEPRTFQTLWH